MMMVIRLSEINGEKNGFIKKSNTAPANGLFIKLIQPKNATIDVCHSMWE